MNKILRIIIFSIIGALLLPIIIFLGKLFPFNFNIYFLFTDLPPALFIGFLLGWLLGAKHYLGLIGAIVAVILGWVLILRPITYRITTLIVDGFFNRNPSELQQIYILLLVTFLFALIFLGIGYLIDIGIRKLVQR